MYHNNYWTAKKITDFIRLIEPLVYRKKRQIESFRYIKLADISHKPPIESNIDDSSWLIIEPETFWGGRNVNFVLRTKFSVPADWNDKFPVCLYLPLGDAGDFSHPEALAYFDGIPCASCDRHHQEILLPKYCIDARPHVLALHGWTGLGGWEKEGNHTNLLMRPCFLVQIDIPTRNFIAAVRVALGIAQAIDEHQPARGKILNALNAAFKQLDTREPFGENFYDSVAGAHHTLRKAIENAGAALDVDLTAVGHAHIDVAWLWPISQTRHKSGRTFYNVLRLMEQFEDFHFAQSQPQLYDYVRQDYPQLFEDIKKRVKKGNWEIIGGMWVEADCNISGAESLARQFLLGRNFFRRYFGVDIESPVLWLPDVFGYTASLPQLIKQAGLKYFFTSKISWNQYNRLPYDSFWWRGIDGSSVLTHFATSPLNGQSRLSTYNAMMNPEQAIGTWKNFQQKEQHQHLLITFGYGDGGGGPTREMLENIQEMKNFPAAPHVHNGTVHKFFKKLEAQADSLPSWNGELYLEFHRGTYTTQSRTKLANRRCEFLLHDAEFLAAWASIADLKYLYPHDELNKAWELVCLNQFHDIIPGSSTGEVYADASRDYAQVENIASSVRDSALSVIKSRTDADIIIVNPTSFVRNDPVLLNTIPDGTTAMENADGKPLVTQKVSDGLLIDAGDIKPFSISGLKPLGKQATKISTDLIATPSRLENRYVHVEFNSQGDITGIYDKVNFRNIIPHGALANQLQAFEDRPLKGEWADVGDAWDIDIFYNDKMWTNQPASSVKVIETGPLRAMLEVRRRILNSDYIQRISLTHNSPQINFDTTINWQERHILLKAAFPLDILSTSAKYEIQWGHIERPTHHNTSWDWAKFETCAQKWVDLSEGNYGVSLINDCKYGHDIHNNLMRISLLRSTTGPDRNADRGEHRFKYSLLPHQGILGTATISAAYALNDPVIVAEKQSKSPKAATAVSQNFIAVDRPNAVIETIKSAHDGRGIIVRLYESLQQRGLVTITCGFDIDSVWQTNLLEDNQTQLEHNGNKIQIMLKPFEIATLRITQNVRS